MPLLSGAWPLAAGPGPAAGRTRGPVGSLQAQLAAESRFAGGWWRGERQRLGSRFRLSSSSDRDGAGLCADTRPGRCPLSPQRTEFQVTVTATVTWRNAWSDMANAWCHVTLEVVEYIV